MARFEPTLPWTGGLQKRRSHQPQFILIKRDVLGFPNSTVQYEARFVLPAVEVPRYFYLAAVETGPPEKTNTFRSVSDKHNIETAGVLRDGTLDTGHDSSPNGGVK